MLKKFIALLAALLVSVPAAALAAPSDDAKAKQQEEAARTSADSPKEKSAAKQVTDAAKSALAAAAGIPLPDDGSAQDKNAENMGGEPDAKDPVAVAKHYCTSPRAAAAIVFGWLNDPNYTAAKSTRCMFPGEGKNAKTRDELVLHAQQLRTIVEEKGISIDLNAISNDPDFRNAEGYAKAEFSKDLPGVYMRRFEGMWGVTPRALQKIEVTYKNGRSFFTAERMEAFPAFLQSTAFGVALWQFIAIILLLLLGMAARKLLYYLLTTRLSVLAKRIGRDWLNRFIEAGISPLSTLLMAGIFSVAYPQLSLPTRVDAILDFIIRLLTIFACVWFFYRISDVFCDLLAEHASKTETKLDDQLVPLARRILKVTIILVGVLFVLQNLSVDIGSLLAGLGIGGIAIAMAAKDTISNFFGSIVIFTDKPFQIGDWVVIDGAEGVVEVVGFRSTQIRTFYDSIITVPNSKMADAKIDNYGLRNYRRCSTSVGIAYETRPEQIQAFVEGIRAILRANEYVRKDYYEVHLAGFGSCSLDIMLYFFLKCGNWTVELTQKHCIFLEIIRLAERLGVRFAYPTQTLYHEFVAQPGGPRPVQPCGSLEELKQVVSSFAPGGSMSQPIVPKIDGGWTADMPDPRQKPAAPANPDVKA